MLFSEHMQTLSVDFHFLSAVFQSQELILAVLHNDDSAMNIGDDN